MNTGNLLVSVCSAALGTLGFGVLVHAPKKSWLPAMLLGGVTYGLYIILLWIGLSDPGSLFLASLFGSMLALSLARRLQTISTTFLMMSIVSFVPGLGLYRCMQYLGAGQTGLGASQGVAAMITIAMITLGQATGSLLYRMVTHRRRVPADTRG